MVNILEVLVLLPRIYAGDAMLFNNPASLAEQENVLLIYVLTIFPGKKHTYFSRGTKNNDIICNQEIHGKDEFVQAIQVLAQQFRL